VVATSNPPASEEPARDAVEALREIYAELDAALVALGGECRACGRCCTFPPGSPVLYATLVERWYLARTPPPPFPPRAAEACPYMDPEARTCGARERRTLGCRTHFCDVAMPSRSAREAAHKLNERALERLRDVVKDCGAAWDYAPVVPWLHELFGHGGSVD